MRRLIAIIGVVIASSHASAVFAATALSRFGVSATVVASCGIEAQSLLSGLKGAPAFPGAVCSSATPQSPIPAPRPMVFITRDGKTGVTKLVVEF